MIIIGKVVDSIKITILQERNPLTKIQFWYIRDPWFPVITLTFFH